MATFLPSAEILDLTESSAVAVGALVFRDVKSNKYTIMAQGSAARILVAHAAHCPEEHRERVAEKDAAQMAFCAKGKA